MHLLRHTVLFFFCLLCLPAGGQSVYEDTPSSNFIPERIFLHTDRQLYISGETIWFKILTFDARARQLSDFSKVAYLELISPEGIAVSQVKVGLESGRGSGTIELTKGLNSGSYSMRAYTQAMRNGDEKAFGRSTLIILNPDQAVARADGDQPGGYQKFEPTQSTMTLSPDRHLNIQTRTSQTTFSQRSLVSLEINTEDPDGRPVAAELSLAVAVKPPEQTDKAALFEVVPAGQVPEFSPPATINFLPEDHNMLLSGQVINEVSQLGAPDIEVYLAFPGETALVYLALTDEAGRFSFLLPRLYGLRQMVLQTRTDTEVPLQIELFDAFHQIPEVVPEPFVLPDAWLPLANAALVNAQIQQAYQSFELPPVFATPNLFEGIPFFGKTNARYVLDEYNRFPLPEFFFEIVIEVLVKGKYGSERVEVANDWDKSVPNSEPLLLVDGVPVFDQSKFLKINNKLIEAAEVVSDPFWLNPRYFNGIIQLHSFEKDGRCFRLPENALQRSFLSLLPERQFVLPDYQTNTDSRTPDFRNTLYWNPSIQTDAEGKATINFYTSDVIGDFEIRLEGLSEDGLAGSSSATIQVVKDVN